MGWTDEEVTQLRALWGEGRTASQVAHAIGGKTRNSVLSKVFRLGLSVPGGHSAAKRPKGSEEARKKPVRTPDTPALTAPFVPEPDPSPGNLVATMDLNSNTCRWPFGEPGKPGFGFCGRRPRPDGPYCDTHHKKSYNAVTHRSIKPAW